MKFRTKPPRNNYDALVLALALAMAAATETDSQEALILAEDFAQGLTDKQIEQAKAEALQALEKWRVYSC